MDTSCDVIIFGATSFVGQILCRYMLDQYGAAGELRWAIAGRSAQKLQTLQSTLGETAGELPVIVANADNETELRAMCEQGRVIISTVGPYALYGETLVKVCAETGTDYCDLTGEVQWIKRMVDRYHDSAVSSGARIVHCCGFDSIPSDMGVWFLQNQAIKAWGEPCQHIQMRVAAFKGGVSGGTVASMMNLAKEAAGNSALRHELADPYSICPDGHNYGTRQTELKGPHFDKNFQTWTAPFVMAAINTRIVHRSNALTNNSYGANFRYDEAILTGEGLKGAARATATAAGSAAMLVGASITPIRNLLERHVVPKPGEGPSEQQQQKGYYLLDFLGHGPGGKTLRAQVRGDRDPGYGSTAKMLGQAGVCLAQDIDCEGGSWTPASIFGDGFIERLQNHAGIRFELAKA